MNATNIHQAEQKSVNAIINGENVSDNMAKIYLSLRPLFKKIIDGFGHNGENEDLMQEMYIALTKAVTQYANPDVRSKYPFRALIITQARYRAYGYLRKFYGQHRNKDGKILFRERPLSLNVKATDEESSSETLDLLIDDTTVESEVIENETAQEHQKAIIELWHEVEKLSPKYCSAIVDHFKNNMSHKQAARNEGVENRTIACRVHNGLQQLRKNPRVHEIASHFIPSLAYRGGHRFFKATGMSSTEYVALKNIEHQDRRKATYQLINPTFFGDKSNAAIERYTGVSNEVIRRLKNRVNGVSWDSAQKIIRFYNLPFNEVFEECSKEVVPKQRKKYSKRITYRLAKADYFAQYNGLNAISREKLDELGIKPSLLRSHIFRLRHNGAMQLENAQQIAYLFGESFEKMFVEA